MPEGHTIHREARDQRAMLVGDVIAVSSPQGRFADGADRLTGARLLAVEAYGKHLVQSFDANERGAPLSLHIHLGLFGKFRHSKSPPPVPRGLVRVRLEGARHTVDVNGPNCCEILDEAQVAALIARIGPDPLRPDADPDRAFARIAKSRAPIGLLLMDQSVMAGIGNIYRTEILWRQRIHPDRPGKSIDRATFDAIWADAVMLLERGVRDKAIITVDRLLEKAGKPAKSRYRERTNIFGRAACPGCKGDIRKYAIATRRVFACEACQPAA